MKKIVLFISRRFPKVYGCLYLILFFLLIIAGACLPYVYRRIVYSTAYEKEFTHGVIEKEITVEEEVAVKRRTTTMYTYFFEIDGHKVMVRPSDCRDYEVGDEFDSTCVSLYEIGLSFYLFIYLNLRTNDFICWKKKV